VRGCEAADYPREVCVCVCVCESQKLGGLKPPLAPPPPSVPPPLCRGSGDKTSTVLLSAIATNSMGIYQLVSFPDPCAQELGNKARVSGSQQDAHEFLVNISVCNLIGGAEA